MCYATIPDWCVWQRDSDVRWFVWGDRIQDIRYLRACTTYMCADQLVFFEMSFWQFIFEMCSACLAHQHFRYSTFMDSRIFMEPLHRQKAIRTVSANRFDSKWKSNGKYFVHFLFFAQIIFRGNRCRDHCEFCREYCGLALAHAHSHCSGHYRIECAVLPRRHRELNCVWVDVKDRHTHRFLGSKRVFFFYSACQIVFPIRTNIQKKIYEFAKIGN